MEMKFFRELCGVALTIGLLAACGGTGEENAASVDQANAVYPAWRTAPARAGDTIVDNAPLNTNSVHSPAGAYTQYQQVCRVHLNPINAQWVWVPGKLFKGVCSVQYGGHSNPKLNVTSSTTYDLLLNNNYVWNRWTGGLPSNFVVGGSGTVTDSDSTPVGICAADYGYAWHMGKFWHNATTGEDLCSYEYGGGPRSDPSNGGNVQVLCKGACQ